MSRFFDLHTARLSTDSFFNLLFTVVKLEVIYCLPNKIFLHYFLAWTTLPILWNSSPWEASTPTPMYSTTVFFNYTAHILVFIHPSTLSIFSHPSILKGFFLCFFTRVKTPITDISGYNLVSYFNKCQHSQVNIS